MEAKQRKVYSGILVLTMTLDKLITAASLWVKPSAMVAPRKQYVRD